MTLTFGALRAANVARLPEFKDAKGRPAHAAFDGSDWSLADWMTALVGELGEAANIMKKVKRGDLTLDEARPLLAKELADTVTYLDIVAFRCGVDLGEATIAKWNEISARVECDLRLSQDGHFVLRDGVTAYSDASAHVKPWFNKGYNGVERRRCYTNINNPPPLTAAPSATWRSDWGLWVDNFTDRPVRWRDR